MRVTRRDGLILLATLVVSVAQRDAVAAQTTPREARDGRPVAAAPMHAIRAELRQVPSTFLKELPAGSESTLVEVLDLSVDVRSRDLDALPPSLQPRLHIGRKSYPVQRVEYSNWDLRAEKPIDERAPVGETRTLHFFIENWQQIERGQLMVLSVLSTEEISEATDGQLTPKRLREALPELVGEIPSYEPREFMEPKRDE